MSALAARTSELFRVPADQFPPSKVWRILHHLADSRTPAVRDAFIKAVAATQNQRTLSKVAKALDAGKVAQAVDAIGWERVGAAQIEPLLEPQFRFLATAPGRAGASGLPRGVTSALTLTNEEAVLWAKARAAELVREISTATRNTLRELATQGIRDGIAPRTTAIRMRSHIGLTQRMSDALLKRPAAQHAAYRAFLIRWRAETIARTETIRAANMGQQFVWREAARQGLFNPSLSQRVWIVTPDDRLCPFCAPMADQLVGFEDDFRSGEIVTSRGVRSLGSVLTPPLHPRCRCAIALRPVRSSTPIPPPPKRKKKPVAIPKTPVPTVPRVPAGSTVFKEAARRAIGTGLRDDTQTIAVGGLVRAEWRSRVPDRIKAAVKKRGRVEKRLTALIDERRKMELDLAILARRFVQRSPGAPVEQVREARRLVGLQVAALRKKVSANSRKLKKEAEAFARLSDAGIERETLREVLAELREFGGAEIAWARGSTGKKFVNDNVTPFFPKEWLEASNRKGEIKLRQFSSRAFYSPGGAFGFPTAEIRFSDHGRADVVQAVADLRASAAHELTHRFEDATADVFRLEEMFFNRRTVGEERVWIGTGSRNEKGFKDEWAHRYMGRTYEVGADQRKSQAYEIMSMTYEELLGLGDYGIRGDDEVIDFALGLLAGAK